MSRCQHSNLFQALLNRKQYKPELLVAVLLTFCLLSGCFGEPTPADRFEDYQTRLTRLLEPKQPPVDALLSLPTLPSKPASQLPVTEQRTGLLEMLQLDRCQLAQLVSERNSSLGRVQAPSLRLAYEIRLLDGLRDCLRTLPNSDPLHEKLNAVFAIKQQEILRVFSNSILSSDEFRANFTRSASPWQPGAPSVTQSAQALGDLRQVADSLIKQQPVSKSQLERIEPALNTLRQHQTGAALLIASSQVLDGLTNSNALLTSELNTVQCRDQQPSETAEYLNNVFQRYYIADIQPLLGQIYQQQQQWEQALDALFSDLPITSDVDDMLAYYRPQQDTSLSRQLRLLIIEHARIWGELFERCGLSIQPRTTSNQLAYPASNSRNKAANTSQRAKIGLPDKISLLLYAPLTGHSPVRHKSIVS